MNKKDTLFLINTMITGRRMRYDAFLERSLRSLKNDFNDDQITRIEDYVFESSDELSTFSPEQFYEYLQTKS